MEKAKLAAWHDMSRRVAELRDGLGMPIDKPISTRLLYSRILCVDIMNC